VELGAETTSHATDSGRSLASAMVSPVERSNVEVSRGWGGARRVSRSMPPGMEVEKIYDNDFQCSIRGASSWARCRGAGGVICFCS